MANAHSLMLLLPDTGAQLAGGRGKSPLPFFKNRRKVP